MNELTEAQAVALANSGFWKEMTHRQIAEFQLFESLLCMPFAVFHEALEKSLGRPVWTHEFGMNIEGIRKEFLGEQPAPSFAEIVALIPEEKRILVIVEPK